MIALQKLWKLFFISSKGFFCSRDIQIFVIFGITDSKGQMEVE